MKAFRLTISGYVYIVFSFSLLLGAFLRGELFALVCGVCLCLYFLLSFIMLFFSFFFFKKKDFLVELKKSRIEISSLQEKKEIILIRFISQVICVFYVFNFLSDLNDKKSRSLNFRIKLQKEKAFFDLPKKDRGRFLLKDEYIELSDIAGFFSFKLFRKCPSIPRIFLYPELSEMKDFVLPEILNETSNHIINIRRNDELYDTRPYIPGDDTRKINWKLYAHTEELTVKQGDFIPPPQNFFTIYIEEPHVNTDFEFYKRKFDEFVNLAASFAAYLYKNGISFNIRFYDTEKKILSSEIIYPDDFESIDLIRKTFSIPQIKIGNKLFEPHNKIESTFLLNDENEKTCLLYFFMPVQSDKKILEKLFYTFKNLNHKSAFYLGPESIIDEPKNFLHSFLFYTPDQKKDKSLSKQMNAKLLTIKSALHNGGFYVYTL